jgi:hypothetical protein
VGARTFVVGATLLFVPLAALVTAGSTLAATVNVCVPKKEGSPLVTAKRGKCGHGYKLAHLGTEGPEGKAGPTGEAGSQGEGGPEGREGSAGFTNAELETLKSVLPYIRYVASGIGGKPTVQFSGVNVQVVSGAEKTAAVNGAGNLVIGYDENPGKREQTGSHDLVLGEGQTFTSYGGLVAGLNNTIAAPFASVAGGSSNVARGSSASVAGGTSNVARGSSATVSGGESNEALGGGSAVSGGDHNHAVGIESSVSGGFENESTGAFASVSGGKSDVAEGGYSSIFGGKAEKATGESEALPSCLLAHKGPELC